MKIFSFKGYATRGEWWGVTMITTFLYIVLIAAFIFGMVKLNPSSGMSISSPLAFLGIVLGIIFTLVCVWVNLAVSVRRCHDRNKSGWWCLLLLLPYIGSIWCIIELGCLKGKENSNFK